MLYSNAFIWGYTPELMRERFDEVYASGVRLDGRAYWDPDREMFVLPHNENWGGEVVLSQRLIENVRRHIEQALALGYVDHIFFPDMGHSHFFIPLEHYQDTYAGWEVARLSEMYTLMLDDPSLLVLYHTAEQLQAIDEDDNVLADRHIGWRFFTRNLVGDNDGQQLFLIRNLEHSANTARNLDGHYYHGAGFSISATETGCFPYLHDGTVHWFDLSLADLPRDPDEVIDYGRY